MTKILNYKLTRRERVILRESRFQRDDRRISRSFVPLPAGLRMTTKLSILNSSALSLSNRFRISRKGFTLVEVLVYIAILAVLAALATNTLLLVQRSLAEIRATRLLNSASAVAMERMVRIIRDAKTINVAASVFDISPGTLSLTGSETPALNYRFYLSGGALALDAGFQPAMALTPPGISVANLVFRRINTPVSQGIKIELALAASTGRRTITQNFYSTVVLRNSYAP